LAAPVLAAEPGVRELMKQAVEPTAAVFWDAGRVPPEGETAAEAADRWRAAAGAAESLQAYAQVLSQAPYAQPGEWRDFTAMMGQAAASGRAATQARDMDAAFEAGGRLYDACNGCHSQYMQSGPSVASPAPITAPPAPIGEQK
ncbi:MAG: hypothetical protein ABW042_04895, partial [Phenylobacterium sp.]